MRVRADQLFILVLAFGLVAAVYVLLEWTRMGKAMRATADNPHLAQIRGINTERVIAWTWMLGGVDVLDPERRSITVVLAELGARPLEGGDLAQGDRWRLGDGGTGGQCKRQCRQAGHAEARGR
ncbi:MAG: hypothetical protein R3215_03000 [Halomonas sp.]|nr:hypothetical protein [Halomonas sp.]